MGKHEWQGDRPGCQHPDYRPYWASGCANSFLNMRKTSSSSHRTWLTLDTRKYLPALLEKRGVNSAAALSVLDMLESIVRPFEFDLYAGLQHQALQRIAMRDADDWPVLACAMTLGCQEWTEDSDFFGTGVAT